MKQFENILSLTQHIKTHLNQDKTYQPISKKWVALLRDIKPTTLRMLSTLKQIDQTYAKQTLDVLNTSSFYIECIDRALELSLKKNKKSIETMQKKKNQDITTLHNELRLKLESIDDEIETSKNDHKVSIVKLETDYKRELSVISKSIFELKRTYEHQIEIVESEKIDALKNLKQVFDQKKKALNLKIDALKLTHEASIKNIDLDQQEKIKASDASYLLIKNDYQQLSIALNQKINEIKKVYQKDIETFNKTFDQDLKPLDQQMEVLKQDYKKAIAHALESYQNKLIALNETFDRQKEQFELKKQRIITETNQAISLFNSKLTAYRESVQKDKHTLTRTLRIEIQHQENVLEKEKMNRDLNKQLNLLDQDLNKQIIRNQKDITLKQQLMQKKLFELDQKHLKEVHDWRFNKQLYSYEHKQELAKLELNFNYNFHDLSLQIKRLEHQYAYEKEKRLLVLNRDLTPLELQLTIASMTQERELNLLSSDTHQVNDTHLYLIKMANLKQQIMMAQMQFEEKEISLNFTSNEAVLMTLTQLELQKEKLKFESGSSEQSIRADIQKLILDKNKDTLLHELTLKELNKALDKQSFEQSYKIKMQEVNQTAYALFQKHQAHISRLKIRALYLKSIKQSYKAKKLSAFEVIKSQAHVEQLTLYQLFLTNQQHVFLNLTKELYLCPAHPEVFKETLALQLLILKEYEHFHKEAILHFKALDLGNFQKKIEDTSSFKNTLQFDHEIESLDHRISEIEKIKDALVREVKQLGTQILSITTHIDKDMQTHKLLLDTLKEDGITPAKIQELNARIKDTEKNTHKLTQQRTTFDQKITSLHKKIVPLDEKITQLEQKKSSLSKKHDIETQHDRSSLQHLLEENTKLYENYMHHINHMHVMLKSFYDKLKSELYVTESVLDQQMLLSDKGLSKVFQMINLFHQQFLNQSLSLYHSQNNKQNHILSHFNLVRSKALLSAKDTSERQIKQQYKKNQTQLQTIDQTHKSQSSQTQKELSVFKTSFIQRLNEYIESIKNHEKKLSDKTFSFKQQIKHLNENQIDVAKSYQFEHQNELENLEKILAKEISDLENERLSLTKSHEEFIASSDAKSKALITRFEASYQKQIEVLKSKKLYYTDKIKKEAQLFDKKKQSLAYNKSMTTKKRSIDLKNMHKAHHSYMSTQKRTQNKAYRYDVVELKKSYHFRTKALKH